MPNKSKNYLRKNLKKKSKNYLRKKLNKKVGGGTTNNKMRKKKQTKNIKKSKKKISQLGGADAVEAEKQKLRVQLEMLNAQVEKIKEIKKIQETQLEEAMLERHRVILPLLFKFNIAFRIAIKNDTPDNEIIDTGIAGPIGNDLTIGNYAKIMIKKIKNKGKNEYIIMAKHYNMEATEATTHSHCLIILDKLQTNPSTDSISNFISLCCNLNEPGETFSIDSVISSVKKNDSSPIEGEFLLSRQIGISYELYNDHDLQISTVSNEKYLFTIIDKKTP